MRFSFGKIWAAAVCLLVFASCAKDTSESYAGIEQRSLDAWMKLHRPELLGNRQEARGFSYYVDVLDAGSTDKADTLIAETDCWVQYEFTARDLNGNVCMTRNAVQAKQQGTFTRYTYYSPYFRYSGSDYTTLLEGSYYALREPLTLSEEYIAEHPDRGLKKRDAGAARYGADALSAFVAGLFVVGRQQRRGLRRAVRTRRQPSRDSSHQGDGPRLQSAGIRGRDGRCLRRGQRYGLSGRGGGKTRTIRNSLPSAESLRDAETDEPELPDTSVDPYKYTWYQAMDTVPQLYISHVFFTRPRTGDYLQLEEYLFGALFPPITNRWPHSTRRSTTCSWSVSVREPTKAIRSRAARRLRSGTSAVSSTDSSSIRISTR